MTLILFGNGTFGEVAIEKFIELSKIYSDYHFRVVTSAKETVCAEDPMFVCDLKKGIEEDSNRSDDLSERFSFPVEIEADINSDRFMDSVPDDALGFCVGFNQKFCASLLDRFLIVVNVHPSVLPFYKGPLPVYWCLKRGEYRTGFTVHVLADEIGDGIIIYQDIVDIDPLMSPKVLEAKIGEKASEYMKDMISRLLTGRDLKYQTLDAENIYKYPVSYLSFPDMNELNNRTN